MEDDYNDFWKDFEIEEAPTQEASFWDAFKVESVEPRDVLAEYPVPELTGPMGLPRVSPIAERTGVMRDVRIARKEEETQQLSEEILDITGAQYDPKSRFGWTLDPKDLALSWDLGRSLGTEAMQAKFKEVYPEGDLRVVPTETKGNVALVRKNPTEPFEELSLLTGISGVVVSEASFLGSIGVVAGPKGAIGGAILTAGGVFIGELIRYQIENARGYGDDVTPAQARTNAALEGAIAGGIDAASRRMFRALGIAPRQADAVSVLEAQQRLSRESMESLGVAFPEAMKGQVSDPFYRGLMLQSGTTPGGKVQSALGRQGKELYDWLAANLDATPTGVLDDNTLAVIASHARAKIDSGNTLGQVMRAETGDILREAVPVWDRTTRDLRNRAYAEAGRLSEGVEFGNFGQVQDAVREMRVGVFARGRPVQQEMRVVGPEGNRLFEEVVPDIEIPSGQLQEMNRLLDAIESMDPMVAEYTASNGVTYSAVEQLARLRTRFFDLKNAKNLDDDIYRQANEMWSSLTNVLENPTSSGSEQFVAAHRYARTVHREHEEVLGNAFLQRTLRSSDLAPETLASKFTNPNNGRLLAQLKPILESRPRAWEAFRDGVVNDIVNGSPTPTAALSRIRRLEQGDSPMLRMLMSEQEQAGLENLLRQRARFETAPVNRALTQWDSDLDRAAEIYNNSTPDELRAFMRSADEASVESGVSASDLSQALKGYVFNDLLMASKGTHAVARDVVNARSLKNRLDLHRKSGKLEAVLSQKDIDMISDLAVYLLPVSETVTDVGGGLAAGAARGKVGQTMADLMTGQIRTGISLGQRVLSNDAIAWVLTRPAMRRAYQPMPETLEGQLRRRALYMQLALRDVYSDDLEPTQNLTEQDIERSQQIMGQP